LLLLATGKAGTADAPKLPRRIESPFNRCGEFFGDDLQMRR
jgi:hypothetical protein